MHPKSPEQHRVLRNPTTPTYQHENEHDHDGDSSYLNTPDSVPSNSTHKHHLHTPKTPHSHYTKKQQLFTSPVSYRNSQQQHQSQLETPDQTPRLNRRKELADAISFGSSSASKFGHGTSLFPIAHSTVGSGRKLSGSQASTISNNRLNLPTLDLKNSIKITIDNEQDSNYSSEGDNISEDEPGFGKITKKLNFNVPSTPKGQITDEKYAYDLHIKEGNNIDEEDYETSVKVKELVNPFLVNDGGDDNNRSKSNVSKSQPSRFDHEIELVHSKTGKKIVRQMDEFEKAIKPKRLSFDHVIETPSTPENKIMLNPLNERSPIEDDTNNGELIRKEKINNPFKVPSKFSSFKTHSTKKPLIFGSLSDLDVDDESQAMSSSNVVSKESREIVYINNKTGERVTQEMDYDQLKIKPKKLNFDGC